MDRLKPLALLTESGSQSLPRNLPYGQVMSARGSSRRFLTPALKQGRDYSCEVTAVRQQDGRLVTARRTVNVSPGRTTVIDFTRPAPQK